MLYRISKVEVLPKTCLRLVYDDGVAVVVDFKPIIAEGGEFKKLADSKFFKQVKVDERGRSLVWPDELDFCADSLRLSGKVETPAPAARRAS
ncbi:MAG: DUF2442 domain-containing protein [Planctomycetes bacterium]|nr:DUF2442 domain-containing protein [Planctomycetota bacterium]